MPPGIVDAEQAVSRHGDAEKRTGDDEARNVAFAIAFADAPDQLAGTVATHDDAIAGISEKHLVFRHGDASEPGFLAQRLPTRRPLAFGVINLDVIAQTKINRAVAGHRATPHGLAGRDFEFARAGSILSDEIMSGANVKCVLRADADAPRVCVCSLPARLFLVGDQLRIGLFEMRDIVRERVLRAAALGVRTLVGDGAENRHRAGGLSEEFAAIGKLEFAFHDKPPRWACLAESAWGKPQPAKAEHPRQMPWLTQVWPVSLPRLRLPSSSDTAARPASRE